MAFIPSSSRELTQFDETLVAQKEHIIELKSVYGVSYLRDEVETSGDGTVTATVGTGEYLVDTSSTLNTYINFSSAARGRYIPGFEGELGIGVRLPTVPSGTGYIRWGLFDDKDGFYFERSSSGLTANVMANGTVISSTDSASWSVVQTSSPTGNVFPLSNGLTLDLTKGNIFQIDFSWYGYGSIYYFLNLPDATSRLRHFEAHRYNPSYGLPINNPNLPIRVSVFNGDSGSNLTAYVAGRQYAVMGIYRPFFRVTSMRQLGLELASDDWFNLVTLRKKTAYASATIQIDSLQILADTSGATPRNVVFELRLQNNSPFAFCPIDYDTDMRTPTTETAIEANTGTITGYSTDMTDANGILIWEGLGLAGAGQSIGQSAFASLNVEIPGQKVLTLGARRLGGSGNPTVDVIFRVREEW